MTTKHISLKLGEKQFDLRNHELARISLKEDRDTQINPPDTRTNTTIFSPSTAITTPTR